MEGGDQRAILPSASDQVVDSGSHLFGGFIGEGDGQYARAGYVMLLHQVRHTMRNHASFAAAGAGQQEQRSFDMRHGGLLLRIQALEKIHLVNAARSQCGGRQSDFNMASATPLRSVTRRRRFLAYAVSLLSVKRTKPWLTFLSVAVVLATSTGCLVFSDRYWRWRLGGYSNTQIALISDSPDVRRLLAEEDTREEPVIQFWREPHTQEEGKRRVEDMIQHPDQYPLGGPDFLHAMSQMPTVSVPDKSYCDVVERSKSKCGRLPIETATYVLVQVTSGKSKGQRGWICESQVQGLFP